MMALLSRHVFFPLWELKSGGHRRQYLRELMASQWCDPVRLHQDQWVRACQAVQHAFEHCPHYKRRFAAAGYAGLRDWDDFRRLPLLSKQDIRDAGDGLISDQSSKDQLVEARTGGSTGKSLTVYFDQHCQQLRNAAAMRSDRWAGWDIGMQIAAIWGNPEPVDTVKKKLRSMLLDRGIVLDTMNINATTVANFVAEWRRAEPEILFGHAHSLYIFAQHLRKSGVADLRPRGIISTSMMLLAPERQVIEETFGCSVTNRYGCEEVGLIACECEEHNGMHLNVDHLVVEFLRDDGSEAAEGEEANVVVTDLINRGMPLIRYQVGDMGVRSDRRCPCGRGLPLMERVTGRQADFLKRPDGSLVAGVSLVERTLTAIPGIEQMQIVQDELHRLQLKVVPDPGFDATAEQRLRDEFGLVFGPAVTIDVVRVESLDRTRAGKYRFAVCNV
jgi:phenylacetate-CoA ligase